MNNGDRIAIVGKNGIGKSSILKLILGKKIEYNGEFIDILTREQIEDAILNYKPTLIFVEHDETFIEKVATKIINLEK